MKTCALLFPIAFAVAFASAQSRREFRTADGFASLTLIPAAKSADSVSAPDSTADTAAFAGLLPKGGGPEAWLEIYLLEKSTGEELRFPVKLSQMRQYMRQRAAAGSTPDARVLALVRSLAVDLKVHMKSPVAGGAK